jgi:hypothetical protein
MRCAGIAALVVALGLPSCASDRVAEAGFWFDRVTFDLPVGDVDRIGGPIRPDEQSQIESVARAELDVAFAGLRIRFTGQPAGFYRVSVVQDIPGRALPVAGASRRVPFGGGVGSVSFRTLGAQAVANAPRDADRSRIIAAIGKGIGRTAAHEFAHQILVSVNLHDTTDPDSYENGISDRPSQFYGTLHWAFARPVLERYLGPQGQGNISR